MAKKFEMPENPRPLDCPECMAAVQPTGMDEGECPNCGWTTQYLSDLIKEQALCDYDDYIDCIIQERRGGK